MDELEQQINELYDDKLKLTQRLNQLENENKCLKQHVIQLQNALTMRETIQHSTKFGGVWCLFVRLVHIWYLFSSKYKFSVLSFYGYVNVSILAVLKAILSRSSPHFEHQKRKDARCEGCTESTA